MCRKVKQTSHSMLPVGACGLVDRQWTKDQKVCWSCAEKSGKLLIPCCLCQPSSDRYLVDNKYVLSCLHTCMICALHSPRGDEIAQVACIQYHGKYWLVAYGIDIQTLNYVHLPLPLISSTYFNSKEQCYILFKGWYLGLSWNDSKRIVAFAWLHSYFHNRSHYKGA